MSLYCCEQLDASTPFGSCKTEFANDSARTTDENTPPAAVPTCPTRPTWPDTSMWFCECLRAREASQSSLWPRPMRSMYESFRAYLVIALLNLCLPVDVTHATVAYLDRLGLPDMAADAWRDALVCVLLASKTFLSEGQYLSNENHAQFMGCSKAQLAHWEMDMCAHLEGRLLVVTPIDFLGFTLSALQDVLTPEEHARVCVLSIEFANKTLLSTGLMCTAAPSRIAAACVLSAFRIFGGKRGVWDAHCKAWTASDKADQYSEESLCECCDVLERI